MSQNQNYCMVNQNNICDNVCVWDGDTSTWTPPAGYTMLIQATTPSKEWAWNATLKVWELAPTVGTGSIGYTWDGTYLITDQPQPAPLAAQPVASGTQTL